MHELLIFLYILLNIYTIYFYFKLKLGIFQAPFLAACASLGVFLPQLMTIYYSNIYNSSLLFNLLFTMITCNIAFTYGFQIGVKSEIPPKLNEIQFEKSKWLFVVFAAVGIAASYSIRGIWMNTLEGSNRSNFILMVNLANYLEIAYLYSIVYLIKFHKTDKLIILIIVVAALLYLESILLLGRRNVALRLGLNILLALSLYYPKTYNYTKYLTMVAFVLGFIINASISTVRTNLKNETISNITSGNINYWHNFKESFVHQDLTRGMDLGNAAIGIEFCYVNDEYDFGLDIWNDFVYNFIPRAFFGDDFKNSLMIKFKYNEIIRGLTHGVTTMTGYFDAFASFSYFGFLKFLIMGYLLGLYWERSKYSGLYRIVYLFIFTQVTSVFTHSPQYIFMRLEFLLFFFLPIIFIYIKKKVVMKPNKNMSKILSVES